MARNNKALCILMNVVLSLVCHSNEAAVIENPYDPFHYYHQAARPRLNFNFLNLNELNSILVRTTVTSASTTYTFTSVATCTRLAAVACAAIDGMSAFSLKVPFPSGFARSLLEAKDNEAIEPTGTRIEATRVPQARMFEDPYAFAPYGPYGIDSSLSREIPQVQPGFNQARFLFSTLTITAFTAASTTLTSTRTLTPGCSAANFFTQCP